MLSDAARKWKPMAQKPTVLPCVHTCNDVIFCLFSVLRTAIVMAMGKVCLTHTDPWIYARTTMALRACTKVVKTRKINTVVFAGTEPWVITLMPFLVNLVKPSSDGMLPKD